jgi:hypothetical protein
MAWSESGLYVSNVINSLNNTIGMDFTLTSAKLALYNNTDTPDYTVAAASAVFSATNEVFGTGWATGGVLVSAANGGGSIAPTITQSPTKSVMGDATDVSVASTTLANAYGLKWYFDSLTPKALWLGIYFGGLPYSTSAGTFAITWAALGIWVVKCVPSGA